MLFPNAHWMPVNNHGPRMLANLGVIMHTQEGNGSLFHWFSSQQLSSNFWIGKKGAIEQYVDTDYEAWAQGSGNSRYNSIEFEGYTTEPLTSQQLASGALLYQWGIRTHKWALALAESPGQKGFGWHGMGGVSWGNHPGCPGDIRRSQRNTILSLIRGVRVPGVKIKLTKSGRGYWIFDSSGRVDTFGDARKYGDLAGVQLAGAIVDADVMADESGYVMLGADDGVFAFGSVQFEGHP